LQANNRGAPGAALREILDRPIGHSGFAFATSALTTMEGGRLVRPAFVPTVNVLHLEEEIK
jgi:hypothetical protein